LSRGRWGAMGLLRCSAGLGGSWLAGLWWSGALAPTLT